MDALFFGGALLRVIENWVDWMLIAKTGCFLSCKRSIRW